MAKIMLVEDDKSLREIYSIRLVAEGYDIVSAGDGEEALGLAVQEKPDLIISDVMMPKISGFDMLDILRSTPETKDIKVIMMTALSSDEQRQRSEALGAAKHLVKSQCGIEDVINAVHEVLGDKPNANAQANISTLNATATPEGKAAAEITPINQPVPDMTNIQTETTTVVAPQDASIPAPDGTRVMPSDQANLSAGAPNNTQAPVMEPTPISAAPVEPQMPTEAQMPAGTQMPAEPNMTPADSAKPAASRAPVEPAPVQPGMDYTEPQAPAEPQTPTEPQAPAEETPVNFNQAPVATPVAVPTMQPAVAQPVAGATIPAQNPALTPQQVLTMMGNGMGSMPQARPMAVIPQVPRMAPGQPMPTMQMPQAPQMPQMAQIPQVPRMAQIPQVPKAGGTLPMPGTLPQVPNVAPQINTSHQMQMAAPQMPAQPMVPKAQVPTPAMPAQNPVAQQRSGGERVLQPIHDPTQDLIREARAKQMADLLGSDESAGPSTITTRSAKDFSKAHDATVSVPTTAQINEIIPPVPQQAGAPAKATPAQTTPAQTAPTETAQAPVAQNPAQALASKIQIDPNAKISDMASIPAPVEEVATPIRPAFVDQLEQDLAKDLAENQSEDSMSARMMKELADDETTKTALELASKMSKEQKEEKIDESQVEMPESVANAQFSSPNISNPNIQA